MESNGLNEKAASETLKECFQQWLDKDAVHYSLWLFFSSETSCCSNVQALLTETRVTAPLCYQRLPSFQHKKRKNSSSKLTTGTFSRNAVLREFYFRDSCRRLFWRSMDWISTETSAFFCKTFKLILIDLDLCYHMRPSWSLVNCNPIQPPPPYYLWVI
jgi:hypothetical protein